MQLRQYGPRLSLLAAVGANSVPLVGVLAFDWSVLLLIFIYWIETGLYGTFVLLKILTAQGTDDPEEYPDTDDTVLEWPNWKHALFDGTFFGIFWLFGGGFAVGLFAQAVSFVGLSARPLVFSTLAFGLAHTGLFWSEHILSGEYKRHGPIAFSPDLFDHIFLMQAILLIGLFVATALGSPLGMVIAFVMIKIGVDLHDHRKRMQTNECERHD